jgi:hypothetical protein
MGMQESKMNEQVKAKWIAALKSGEYKQCKGALKQKENDGVRHCCLGVLLEVLGPTVVEKEECDERSGFYRIIDLRGYRSAQMPTQFARDVAGLLSRDCCDLADMNDTAGASFEQIAKHIEDNL